MIISRAQVEERFDPTMLDSEFWAFIDVLGESKLVSFTTPFIGAVKGGFAGHIPAAGSVVLVCQPDESSSWYFLAGTYEKELITEGAAVEDMGVVKSQRVSDITGGTGAGTGNPHRVVLQDEFGNGLGLFYEKRGGGEQNVKTELKSGKGKRISLNDSGGVDQIVIETAATTGGLCKVTMGDDDPGGQTIASDSYTVESTGPQTHLNYKSATNLYVLDGGKELQIVNKATGENKAPSSHSGNVNIQSTNKDINLLTLAKAGEAANIFIECLGGVDNQTIQIKVAGDGTIRIQSGGKIELDAASDIDINAGENVNIRAGGSVSVDAGGGNLHLKASGQVNADGTSTWLQSGQSSPTAPNIGTAENKYGTDGITTY